jgi:hypothetical protein
MSITCSGEWLLSVNLILVHVLPVIDTVLSSVSGVSFHSTETLCSIAEGVWLEAVSQGLNESLELPLFFLERTPHFLVCDLERKRIELSKKLLEFLPFEKQTLFQ